MAFCIGAVKVEMKVVAHKCSIGQTISVIIEQAVALLYNLVKINKMRIGWGNLQVVLIYLCVFRNITFRYIVYKQRLIPDHNKRLNDLDPAASVSNDQYPWLNKNCFFSIVYMRDVYRLIANGVFIRLY